MQWQQLVIILVETGALSTKEQDFLSREIS